jgi:hypothetical protein
MMHEDLFETPADSPQQVAFDKKVDEINEGVRLVVQAAFNFDTLHMFDNWFFEVERTFLVYDEYDFEEVEDYSIICCYSPFSQKPPTLTRNFHTHTQRIFGFAHDNLPELRRRARYRPITELHLISSGLSGPAIASTLLKRYRLKLSFDTYYFDSADTFEASIWDLLYKAELVLNNETLEDLIHVKNLVDETIKKIHIIEVMCKMKENYMPYLQEMEEWLVEANESTPRDLFQTPRK